VRPGAVGVDLGDEEVGVVGEDVLEGCVVREGRFAAEVVPGVPAALEPFALDVGWLLGFDGSWREAGFALGDACPDERGGFLAFALKPLQGPDLRGID
jgi:hypothetical protein